MGKMVRTSVIGLLNKGITFEDVQGFINDKLSEKALTGFKTVQGISITESGEQQRHIKFSRVFAIDKLDHRWNLSLSREFRDAGYGDVAWKFTEVDSEDPEAEDTTVSIHPDLFKACLDEDECRRHPTPPPKPFGSEAFWQWSDDLDE
jgi:hypothetical protein